MEPWSPGALSPHPRLRAEAAQRVLELPGDPPEVVRANRQLPD